MRVRRVPYHHFFHIEHGLPYHLEDSLRGVLGAIRRGFGWIDLDCHVTADGVLVITHWPRPIVHDGFYDPKGKIPRHARIEDLTWKQVKRLRTHVGNYRIMRADHLVPDALRHGIRVELELKSTRITAEQLADLRSHLDRPNRVQVKALPQFHTALKAAHDAGFKTIILGRGARIPASAQTYITYRRGPVRWTADL